MTAYLVFNEKLQSGVIIEADSKEHLQQKMEEKRIYEFDVYECTAKFREKRTIVNVLGEAE